MKLRRTLAGLALASSILVGTAALADAEPVTSPTSPTTPTASPAHGSKCDKARAGLQKRVDMMKAHIAKIETRIAQLRKEGHDKRADALAKGLQRAKKQLANAQTRLDKFDATRCGKHDAPPRR